MIKRYQKIRLELELYFSKNRDKIEEIAQKISYYIHQKNGRWLDEWKWKLKWKWKSKNRPFFKKQWPLKFEKSVASDILAPDYRKDSASDDGKLINKILNS